MLLATSKKLLIRPLAARMLSFSNITTTAQSNIQQPSNLQQLLDFFDKKDASNNRLCIIHFTAKWNPKCKTALENYRQFALKNKFFTHFVVDTEEQERTRLYFGARYQPEFLVLYDGAIANRMIGYDMDRLQSVVDRVSELHENRDKYAPGAEDVRQNYYDEHDRDASVIEQGRDAFDTCFESLEKQYLTRK